MDAKTTQPYPRSPYARTPLTATVKATRTTNPAASATTPIAAGGPPPPPVPNRRRPKPKQQMSVVVPFDNSELMSLSAATLSSFPLGVPETTYTSRSAGFDTALYDPSSDSVHILPHSRQRSTDSQDSGIIVGNARSSNRSKFVYSPSGSRSSFDLPLRNQTSTDQENNTTTSVSSFKIGHIRGKTVE